MIIPENIIYVLDTLTGKGFEAYMVGGSVRDMVMGKEPSDFDITANALPEEIIECFEGKKMVLSGMKHGTVAPIINHEAIEITTYRVDGEYKDSRRPEEVFFTRSLREDLKRRDFTVNAMAMDKNFNIIDPYDGRADIENKVIRCVGEAEKRFSEDALRIMRGLRFSSVLGFSIEEETKNAILKLYPLLSNIAKERIFTELKKLVTGENAGKILSDYKDVFLFIMPLLSSITENKFFENAKKVKGDLATAFGILFDGLTPEDSGKILSSLKSDNALKTAVTSLIKDKNEDILTEVALKNYLRERADEDAERLIEYKYCLGLISEEEKNEARKILSSLKGACIRIKDLDIKGSDLVNMGFEGSKIGVALEALLSAVIEKKCENTKTELLEYVKKL